MTSLKHCVRMGLTVGGMVWRKEVKPLRPHTLAGHVLDGPLDLRCRHDWEGLWGHSEGPTFRCCGELPYLYAWALTGEQC